MLYVLDDHTIRLTRGDTARLTVGIVNEFTGSDYVVCDGDVLTLTVKKKVNDSVPIISKAITGSSTFLIEPHDTESLDFTKYKYDVQLTTEGGEVYTVIEPSVFEIMPEVTY